ncbi:MAG: rRNA maturation RNase YbeY [Frankia sp.]
MAVYVANESGAEVDETELVALCRFVLGEMRVDPLAELSVILVDADAMEALHVQYMGEEGPTDVLAFQQDDVAVMSGPDPGDDDPVALLGDVVLCPEVAARQAADAGHGVAQELHLLCTHGILHLLGYDHGEPAQEREMWAVQDKVLTAWRAAAEASGAR